MCHHPGGGRRGRGRRHHHRRGRHLRRRRHISKELTIIGQGAGQTIITTPRRVSASSSTGDIDSTAGDLAATVTIKGFTFDSNSVGVRVSSGAHLDHLVITDSNFQNNTGNGVGMGSGAPFLGAIDIIDSTFTQNGNTTDLRHRRHQPVRISGRCADQERHRSWRRQRDPRSHHQCRLRHPGRRLRSRHPPSRPSHRQRRVRQRHGDRRIREDAALCAGLHRPRRADLPQHRHDPQRPCRLGHGVGDRSDVGSDLAKLRRGRAPRRWRPTPSTSRTSPR